MVNNDRRSDFDEDIGKLRSKDFMKKALLTGITGQDGSYLAELLLSKGYEVHGIIRRSSTFNTRRIEHLYNKYIHDQPGSFFLHYGDLTSIDTIVDLIYNVKPDEVYNLAAQSHVKVSFEMPEYTGNVTGLGTIRILEAIRKSKIPVRFYQASSSEMFGSSPPPQNEQTPFCPQSPYAAAKLYSYWVTKNYREGYNMFACNGILFNHESPRRGETFVTRKITRAIARILKGQQKVLFLGNLDAKRDWGYAPEYVEAMWLMLQQPNPDDYVIGTGVSYSVRDFVEEAFDYAGLDWKKYVRVDPKYFRPNEVEYLMADSSKARECLGWFPKVSFRDLIRIMVDADLECIGLTCPGEGKKIIQEKFNDWLFWDEQIFSMETEN